MKNDKGHKMTLRALDGRAVVVRLEINPKARRLILRLDEKRREAVAVAPHQRQLPAARRFASERADWIADRLDQLPGIMPLSEGAIFPFRGEDCRLTAQGTGRIARLVRDDGLVLVVPGEAATLPARALRFLKKAAHDDLEAAVARHARALGVVPARISIKDTRSRWGSCTSDGRLSFSWRLICAPPDVLDYVAAHECAHMLEMNHSPAFWAHVARVRPDWKRQRAWLRGEGRGLHAVGAG